MSSVDYHIRYLPQSDVEIQADKRALLIKKLLIAFLILALIFAIISLVLFSKDVSHLNVRTSPSIVLSQSVSNPTLETVLEKTGQTDKTIQKDQSKKPIIIVETLDDFVKSNKRITTINHEKLSKAVLPIKLAESFPLPKSSNSLIPKNTLSKTVKISLSQDAPVDKLNQQAIVNTTINNISQNAEIDKIIKEISVLNVNGNTQTPNLSTTIRKKTSESDLRTSQHSSSQGLIKLLDESDLELLYNTTF